LRRIAGIGDCFNEAPSLWSDRENRNDFPPAAKISLTPISAPRILKFRDALFREAIAVFYFLAKSRH
jgi:hypothetical protein